MKHELTAKRAELEALLHLKRSFLRAAQVVAGGSQSSAAAILVAGTEAARIRAEIDGIELQIGELEAA